MTAADREPEIVVVEDAEALAREAAARFVRAAREAIATRGRFAVGLAGGRTPQLTYRRLSAEAGVDWRRVELFWGDERAVPPTHPQSNYRMAEEALLRHVPLRPEAVHRMRAEAPDLEEAAAEYEALLVERLASPPRLDLVHLRL